MFHFRKDLPQEIWESQVHRNLTEIDELVDGNFRGSCILKIYQAYIGSSKSISLSVEEILVREVDRKESYFADEGDDEYEESDDE